MLSFRRVLTDSLALCIGVTFCLGAPSGPEVTSFRLRREGAFDLEAQLTVPRKLPADALAGVVVYLHGSGPQSMDEELKEATLDKATNPFFRDLEEHLSSQGFASLRYHKRSYQAQLLAKQDPRFLSSAPFQSFAGDTLGSFLADGNTALDAAKQRLPGVPLYLLGHSQGSYLALQIAHTRSDLAGLGLIGFSFSPIRQSVFEQTVYRPLEIFRKLDRNRNLELTSEELIRGGAHGASLLKQLAWIDLDQSQTIGQSEFQAANYTHLHQADFIASSYVQKEAALPTVAAVLRKLTVPVAFFQGTWDNQTPVYHTQSVDLLTRHQWKEKQFLFRYFPQLGHGLDPRDSYEDIVFRRADPEALQVVAETLRALVP